MKVLWISLYLSLYLKKCINNLVFFTETNTFEKGFRPLKIRKASRPPWSRCGCCRESGASGWEPVHWRKRRQSWVTYSGPPGTCAGCPDRWSCWRCRDTGRHTWTGRFSRWAKTPARGCVPRYFYQGSTKKEKKKKKQLPSLSKLDVFREMNVRLLLAVICCWELPTKKKGRRTPVRWRGYVSSLW